MNNKQILLIPITFTALVVITYILATVQHNLGNECRDFFTCRCQINQLLLICIWSVTLYLSLTFIVTQDYEEEEVEGFDVSLTKNTQGLGITIAGYVGDKNSGEKLCNRSLRAILAFPLSNFNTDLCHQTEPKTNKRDSRSLD